jgi:hypothetical protein
LVLLTDMHQTSTAMRAGLIWLSRTPEDEKA